MSTTIPPLSQVCIYNYCLQLANYRTRQLSSYIVFCHVQGQIDGLCRFLLDDCKEDLPHWKQLLQDNEVFTPSWLYGVTNDQLCSEILHVKNCAFQQCLKQCSCHRCECLLKLWSDLSIAVEDDEISTSYTKQKSDCWYILNLMLCA